MKIFLIGLSGAGKTTLGKLLADELHVPFVDMDWEIEKKENKSVREIFSREGEDHFRRLESEVLRDWAGAQQDFVMGTGGGAPCFHNGMEIINQSGLSFFLVVPFDILIQRLASATFRPLLCAGDDRERENKLNALRASRLPIYTTSHIIIENPSLEQLLSALRLKR